MFIACLRLTLALPENDSLKGKRAVVRRLRDRVRQRFPVAVAEVETLDDRRLITIGVACVTNDAAHGHAVLMTIRDFRGRFSGSTRSCAMSRRRSCRRSKSRGRGQTGISSSVSLETGLRDEVVLQRARDAHRGHRAGARPDPGRRRSRRPRAPSR